MGTGTLKHGGPLTVALTGGIGSGKSTISNLFAGLGAPVIDADEISRSLAAVGGRAYGEIRRLVGDDCLDNTGNLRRELLRQRAFSDPSLLTRLEAIIHPMVREEIRHGLAEVRFPYCIVSVPLLVETGMNGEFDFVAVVDVPVRVQIERTMSRDRISREEVERILRSQASREARLAMADFVIDNDRSREDVLNQVRNLHETLLGKAEGVARGR